MAEVRRTSLESNRDGERGWALLGLILALSIMAITLSSVVVPNVKTQVQRDKETEMMYRGEQMARAIARYYGRGNLIPLQLMVPPEYGYLTDTAKQRASLLKPGSMFLHQPEIPVPLLVQFPFPAWATRKDEVAAESGSGLRGRS